MIKVKNILLFFFFCINIFKLNAQSISNFVDFRDGKVYKIVTIGTQTWFAENLSVSKFRNGELIPELKSKEEWESAAKSRKPGWCYYNNDSSNGSLYGKLYNFYAVIDPRGLAPKDWHVPSFEEWIILSDFLGGSDSAGIKLKSENGWPIHTKGLNSFNFNGLPYGIRWVNGSFKGKGSNAIWWTTRESTKTGIEWAWHRNLGYYNRLDLQDNPMGCGFSLRLIKDGKNRNN